MADKLNFSKMVGGESGNERGSWVKMTTQFFWNYSNADIIARKGIGKELNKTTADIIARYSDEYVPYLSSRLSKNVQTYGAKDHGTISYKMPYAANQYYNESYIHNLLYHPLATSYWDKAAWNAHKEQITKEVSDARKRLSV